MAGPEYTRDGAVFNLRLVRYRTVLAHTLCYVLSGGLVRCHVHVEQETPMEQGGGVAVLVW